MTHGFENEALEAYRETAAWYEAQHEGLGEEFVAAVESVLKSITQQPEPLSGDGRPAAGTAYETVSLLTHFPLVRGTGSHHGFCRDALSAETGLLAPQGA